MDIELKNLKKFDDPKEILITLLKHTDIAKKLEIEEGIIMDQLRIFLIAPRQGLPYKEEFSRVFGTANYLLKDILQLFDKNEMLEINIPKDQEAPCCIKGNDFEVWIAPRIIEEQEKPERRINNITKPSGGALSK